MFCYETSKTFIVRSIMTEPLKLRDYE